MRTFMEKGRTLSLLLSALLVLCLLPGAAFGAEDQIVSGRSAATRYYDDSGRQIAEPYDPGSYDYAVTLTKSVTDTVDGEKLPENEFEITLDVKTTVDVSTIEISPDAAVVLVLDMSSSMVERDGYGDIVLDHTIGLRGAAADFVEAYGAGATPGARRLVSVVQFGSEAMAASSGFGWNGWMDAATAQGMAETKTAIAGTRNGFILPDEDTDSGATFLSGGLLLAHNLLRALTDYEVSPYKDIGNYYVILFTDGAPTYRSAEGQEDDDSITYIPHGAGWGIVVPTDTGNALQARYQAEKITNRTGGLGAELFTIAYRLDPVPDLLLPKAAGGIATRHYTADDAGSLRIAFQSIDMTIRKWAQAWTVTDPMAPYIVWHPSNAPDATQSFGLRPDTFVWNIRDSVPRSEEPTPGKWVHTYTCSYRITLDNLRGYEAGTAVRTNDNDEITANLLYCMERTGVVGVDEQFYEAAFLSPEIKGYAADELLLTKVGSDGKLLADCVFVLESKETDGGGIPVWRRTETSGADGTLRFTAIPSGHTYTLREISAADGYIINDTVWHVLVSYGSIMVAEDSPDGPEVYSSADGAGSMRVVNESTAVEDEGEPDDGEEGEPDDGDEGEPDDEDEGEPDDEDEGEPDDEDEGEPDDEDNEGCACGCNCGGKCRCGSDGDCGGDCGCDCNDDCGCDCNGDCDCEGDCDCDDGDADDPDEPDEPDVPGDPDDPDEPDEPDDPGVPDSEDEPAVPGNPGNGNEPGEATGDPVVPVDRDTVISSSTQIREPLSPLPPIALPLPEVLPAVVPSAPENLVRENTESENPASDEFGIDDGNEPLGNLPNTGDPGWIDYDIGVYLLLVVLTGVAMGWLLMKSKR